MEKRLLHDYGKLKLIEIQQSFELISKDTDYCWTLDMQIEDFKKILTEYLNSLFEENKIKGADE